MVSLRVSNIFSVLYSFLETSVPLLVLIEAAKAGNEKEVEDYAQVFTEHANKLVEVRDKINEMISFFNQKARS